MPEFSEFPELPYKKYIEYLKETGRMGAASSYGSHLFVFQQWLEKNGHPVLEDINPVMVEQYLSTLNSHSAVKGLLAAVKGYFKYVSQSLPHGHASVIIETQRLNQLSGIRPKRKPKVMKKMSLTIDELKDFLAMLRDSEVSDELYAGVVVLFYFGARSGELAGLLADAKVNMQDRSMQIQTEKTGVERYLAWNKKLDPFMKVWYSFVKKTHGLDYPGQWVTKKLKQELKVKKVIIGETEVTSRTARRTFETQMRLAGVQDIVIRAVLGHMDNSISDVYTDWTMFVPEIRKAMINKNYMIVGKVI